MSTPVTTGASSDALEHELRAAGPGLAGNPDVLRAILAASGDCIKILGRDGSLQFLSEGGKRVMEVDDFSKLKGCPWPTLWDGDGADQAAAAITAANRGEMVRFRGPAPTAKGTPKFWDVQVSPIFGPTGSVVALLSISRDMTEEWRAEIVLREAIDRQRMLTDELQHRIKNTLAMVGAIANQTLRNVAIEQGRESFQARLQTLSQAHDLLTQASWNSAKVDDIVQTAIRAHQPDGGRIEINGPPLQLDAKKALALAMALHELATNALKHGAWSSADGRVSIGWHLDSSAGRPKFRFRWAESGGPPVSPPTRTGFGSKLLDRVIRNEFHGDITIDYAPSGLTYELIAPADPTWL